MCGLGHRRPGPAWGPGPATMPADRDPGEAFEAFVALWQRLLAEGRRPGTTVVVEGERDRRAVRRLGWAGGVAIVHRGQPLSATAQRLVDGHGRVIVLTDWDSEGGTIARRLREFLTADRVALDLDYRRRLAYLLRGELVHVEGLYGWVRRNAERYRVPLESIVDAEPDEAGAPTG
jgi:5S rRNA maturation endonuclease (ribonuclease M5)